MLSADSDNLGVAFGLVIGAGLSTAVGGAVVFVPSLTRLANRRVLAGALGLSAGVMLFVSFAEIFRKSQTAFEDAGFDSDKSFAYAVGCFFAGVSVMEVLHYLVFLLLGDHHHHHDILPVGDPTDPDSWESATLQETQQNELAKEEDDIERPPSDKGDGVGDCYDVQADHSDHDEQQNGNDDDSQEGDKANRKQLLHLSTTTALAVTLHNFPEGLVTFVTTLDDPKVGVVLGIAIAVHNIPEGLCISMPIFYATGNRWKAFSWAVISGIAEPLAALLGWLAFANWMSDLLYGIAFGVVSGMMVIICARELLPTAHRFDPDDHIVTYSFMVGMFIMAFSLVMFVI